MRAVRRSARLATMQDQSQRDLSMFLAGIPFFAPLGEATRLEIAGHLEPLHVPAGEVLFRQGDTGDGLYLVASGRLRVTAEADGHERMLYDLGRGAIVGEMALLTDRPRAATVHAVRDSDLRVLRVPAFRSLLERNPALVLGMMRLLADRLASVDRLLIADRRQAMPPARLTIAVVAAGHNPRPAAQLAGALAGQLAHAGPVLRVDAGMVERELGPGAAQRQPGEAGRAELTEWLHAVERSHDHMVYQADTADTAWSRLCLSQADVVLLAASAGDDPAVGPVEARALATPSLRCELALLHPAEPSRTSLWLNGRGLSDHHHLRDGRPEDLARLVRMITGTGCGLVLGGGGPRGFAHLGVMRALEDAGVPIDVVGGTSIGAIMAGVFAVGMDDAQRVKALTDKVGRLITLTLPMVAVSSGRRVDRLLAERLGSVAIEDLPRRFFCVSASLNRAEEVVHERGPLATAVRASVSLPGIFPPVCDGEDLLVDGAALNNVPADLMRGRVGSGSVIAVSVSPAVEPLVTVPFGPGLSGWRVFGRRLNPFASPQPVPNIADIVTRSTSLSQVRHRQAALDDDHVDLLLRPPVAGLGALDFKGAVALIDASYAYTAQTLATSGFAQRFVG